MKKRKGMSRADGRVSESLGARGKRRLRCTLKDSHKLVVQRRGGPIVAISWGKRQKGLEKTLI